MDSRRLIVLIVLSLSAIMSSATSRGQNMMMGGYEPIKNLKDPHVVDVAEFAVDKHNADKGTNLKLIEVVKGESQVVDGVNYRLTISADDGTNTFIQHYLTVVHENFPNEARTLASFEPLVLE